ncbi:MAG: tRNA (adenosine(37)-N6)-dimethylallyltransferase MiaA [Gammaproteobacteria bacterium]
MPISVICLMGPTCSGKTQLALELVQRLPCSIISVDSTMVYRGMDIGTAKPTKQQLAVAPHRLIDICDPAEPFSAGQFCNTALREIQTILAAGSIPLLVGGTMLYFRALQQGLSPLPTANPSVRQALMEEAQKYGWQALHRRLAEVDPIAAGRIHPNDPQRIQRALEVYLLTNKNQTELWAQSSANTALMENAINIVLAPNDRGVLQEHIQQRWHSMIQQGFIAEVEQLFHRGDLNRELPALRAVGYRQVWDYLAGQLDYSQMEERAIIATRQLAKRQLTWLRGWNNATWFDSQETKILERVLQHLKI